MKIYDKHYINGAWVKPEGSETIDVINASTEEVMGRIPAGTAGDVDKAVAAAKAAFDSWTVVPPEERGAILVKLSEGLKARSAEIAETIAGCA